MSTNILMRKWSGLVIALCAGLLATALSSGLSGMSASAASFSVTLQGETMTSSQGYGVRVKSDPLADGGKYLLVNSAVTVVGSLYNAVSTDQIQLRLRTDASSGTGASARISVDGNVVTTLNVPATNWTLYTLNASLLAGSHKLSISFLNPSSRNLFIDRAQFIQSSPISAPVPTASPTPIPTSTSTGGENRSMGYVTGYSYWDNTPAGSATISDPVLHSVAAGTGSYADPITVAVGHSIISSVDILDFPKGTRFYVPNLRRYFIVEDTCGDGKTPQNGACHTGYPSAASFWIDVWVGGGTVNATVSNSCMNAITGVHVVITNPASNYAVTPGEISANCIQYGDTVVSAAG